ncbi:cytochrome c family protein [Salidesulfovibrio onnuriiensis]|uniref:cytochrome c family protein n=1 Tax=Salidesulfovibrio onnuriiensis TaxID=2583823 RepID=UPI0011CAD53E|nr:cytochrome c family protein [Salidesulfovibrio onnuriiensis]
MRVMCAGVLLLAVCWLGAGAALAQEARFIGTRQCAECHEEQFENYQKYSKKAHSWESVKIMLSDLKPKEAAKCFECHTTGYGKPGGFTSYEATPEMADVGCETCHGPGSLHAEDGDPELISRTPTIQDCQVCHSEERVGDFNFKPLLFSGAH